MGKKKALLALGHLILRIAYKILLTKEQYKELGTEFLAKREFKIAGNRMLCFRCQSEIKGELRPFEIKFGLGTCKWFLWKM